MDGRLYAAYGIYKPLIPIDDEEIGRNDLQHCKFTLLLHDRFYLAPLHEHPHRILDLGGTGSGIWAIDMADKLPSAEVIGVDTAPTQPNTLPPNLVFAPLPLAEPGGKQIDDVENDWLWAESSFDFIHARELVMAVHDWPRLVGQAYRRLRPGGYLQLAGSVPDFQSDDGTLQADSAYRRVGQIYFAMSQKIGASGRELMRWWKYLEEAGFTDVVERVLKIPTNAWPKDARLKKVGMFELEQFRYGIANMFARGYADILQGDPAAFQVLLAKARQEALDRNIHSWVPYYVVYGRRPD